MRTARLPALVAALLALVAMPGSAAPSAGPCPPTGGYDPACDVDHNGVIDVTDIQLTAGHWNQSGTWVSDNNHNHLGQWWSGVENPLKLTGWYNWPHYAPLVLSNSAGSGLYVEHARSYGVIVGSADYAGLYVSSAGEDGVYVSQAGRDGVYVYLAGEDGVYANTSQASGEWGFYTDDAIHGSNLLMHSLSLVAQVIGPDSLTPGDIVAVAGTTDPIAGSAVHTPLVRLAGETFTNVVGVVESRLALTQQSSHGQPAKGETSTETPVSELRSVDGPAQAGDYVAITVLGAAQVKVDDAASIAAGQRLTISANGRTRPLGTIKVQLAGGEGTADIAESAPVIGVALETPDKDGLVWVLVNPQ